MERSNSENDGEVVQNNVGNESMKLQAVAVVVTPLRMKDRGEELCLKM